MKRCSGALNGSACNESERGLGVCTGEGVSQRIHRIGIMEISKELGQQRGTEGPRRGRERRGERLVSGGMEGASCDTTGRNVTRRMTHVGKPNVLGKRGYAHSEAEKKKENVGSAAATAGERADAKENRHAPVQLGMGLGYTSLFSKRE